MDYIVSSTEDRKLHKKFHDAFVGEQVNGIPVGKNVLEKARVVKCVRTRCKTQEGKSKEKGGVGMFFGAALRRKDSQQKEEDDTIIEVRRSDHRGLKNLAERVLDVVENELGAVRIEKKDLWSARQEGEAETKDKTSPSLNDRYRVYLYIHNVHCIGLLLAERIQEGRKVLPSTHMPGSPEESTTPNPFFRMTKSNNPVVLPQGSQAQTQTQHLPTPPPSSPMMMLEDAHTKDNDDSDGDFTDSTAHPTDTSTHEHNSTPPPPHHQPQEPLMASTTPTPASLGISRIWILSPFRASGIAHSLLETARTSFGGGDDDSGGCNDDSLGDNDDSSCNDKSSTKDNRKGVESGKNLKYEKNVIAFSQPTEMGRRFAERWWGGSDGWLVYD